jgi:hypothetical protein
MTKFAMVGMAAIVGLVAMAGTAMAHDIDVLVMDVQPDVGIYELTLMPDGADLLMGVAVLAAVYVVPDGLDGAAIMVVQTASLTEPLATRGAASSTMVDDAMRLWRVRTVDAFTTSPDLLI